MTVENQEVVDIVALSPDGSSVRLVVADHLEWGAPVAHMLAIQEKLNRYIAFIESGEMVAKFPNAAGRSVVIEIRFLHDAPAEALDFLDNARSFVSAAGWSLQWGSGGAPIGLARPTS